MKHVRKSVLTGARGSGLDTEIGFFHKDFGCIACRPYDMAESHYAIDTPEHFEKVFRRKPGPRQMEKCMKSYKLWFHRAIVGK